MKPIADVNDLQEARSQTRAFIFLYVQWATQARLSKLTVEELPSYWQVEQGQLPTAAYFADLSDQTGDVWNGIRDWLQSEGMPVDPLTYGGNGALLWVRDGRVMEFAGYVDGVALSALKAITRRVFGETE